MLFDILCEPFFKGIVFRRSFMCSLGCRSIYGGLECIQLSPGLCRLSSVKWAPTAHPFCSFLFTVEEKQGTTFSRTPELQFTNKRAHVIFRRYFLPELWADGRVIGASQQECEKHLLWCCWWASWKELPTIHASPWEPTDWGLQMEILMFAFLPSHLLVLYLVTIPLAAAPLSLPTIR